MKTQRASTLHVHERHMWCSVITCKQWIRAGTVTTDVICIQQGDHRSVCVVTPHVSGIVLCLVPINDSIAPLCCERTRLQRKSMPGETLPVTRSEQKTESSQNASFMNLRQSTPTSTKTHQKVTRSRRRHVWRDMGEICPATPFTATPWDHIYVQPTFQSRCFYRYVGRRRRRMRMTECWGLSCCSLRCSLKAFLLTHKQALFNTDHA